MRINTIYIDSPNHFVRVLNFHYSNVSWCLQFASVNFCLATLLIRTVAQISNGIAKRNFAHDWPNKSKSNWCQWCNWNLVFQGLRLSIKCCSANSNDFGQCQCKIKCQCQNRQAVCQQNSVKSKKVNNTNKRQFHPHRQTNTDRDRDTNVSVHKYWRN